MKVTIEHEMTNDELFQILEEANLSAPDKKKILNILFPSRGCTDNAKLVGTISDFIYTN